jgi:hypothetical protein
MGASDTNVCISFPYRPSRKSYYQYYQLSPKNPEARFQMSLMNVL